MNGFYARIIADLQAGKSVEFRESGNSMTPLIKHRQKVRLQPIADPASVSVGDVVLAKVRGAIFTHLVTGIRGKPGKLEFRISNNHGHVNGWTRNVYGKCVAVLD